MSSSPFEHIRTVDLLQELVDRGVDYRLYKQIYNNHLRDMQKAYEERDKKRSMRFIS